MELVAGGFVLGICGSAFVYLCSYLWEKDNA
jgi:hypothetical protein